MSNLAKIPWYFINYKIALFWTWHYTFRRFEERGQPFEKLEDLVESMVNYTSLVSSDSSSDNEEIVQSAQARPTSSSNSTEGGTRNEIQQIEEEKRCKVCRTRNAQVVILPCGHLCCCLQCSTEIQFCPVCKVKVNEKIRVYASWLHYA